jgi:hypothetical protein
MIAQAAGQSGAVLGEISLPGDPVTYGTVRAPASSPPSTTHVEKGLPQLLFA